MKGDVDPGERKTLAQKGQRRLASEPLDATALWLSSLDKSPAKARRILELASSVSRRERVVQLELMRLTAVSGELAASIDHLDHVLMVAPKAGPQMLQGIAAGLNQPGLAALLKPYERRPWYRELLLQAVSVAPRPENAAKLLMQGELSDHDLPANLLPQLLGRLAEGGNLDTARKLATRFAGVSSKSLDQFSPSLSNTNSNARPLTWSITDEDNIIGEFKSSQTVFDVERGGGGNLLSRVTGYGPGMYKLVQNVKATSEDVRLTWKMQCAYSPSAADTWSQRIPVTAESQTFETELEIPSKCPTQSWQLFASNFAGSSSSTIELSKLNLIRVVQDNVQ